MAQKKQVSKPQGFTHGLVSDPDPRFQIKGSYTDALNIRLTNDTGDTFTVENIKGNTLLIDLFGVQFQSYIDAVGVSSGILETRPDIQNSANTPGASTLIFSEIYADPKTIINNQEVGSNFPSPQNPSPGSGPDLTLTNQTGYQGLFPFFEPGTLPETITNVDSFESIARKNHSNIVGYVSVGKELILIIVVATVKEIKPDLTAIDNPTTRTVFLRLTIDDENKVESVEDLLVSYSFLNGNYPDLNMNIDNPVRVEAIVENESITRIYWTDNKNPLRTLNTRQSGKNLLPPSSLNLTPLVNASQPVLDLTLNGSLPVGTYQYVYKYISANGGESSYSPLSNFYHVSEEGFATSTDYGGSPKGEIGSQGFRIVVEDLDTNFSYIELYALLYEDLNIPPRVGLVDRKLITDGATNVVFNHLEFTNEISNGLEEVLIETNTWDVCKDIAIKDNILFAGNLRQKRNFISEKEWNVKILRHNISSSYSPPVLDQTAMLTSTDPEVPVYFKESSNSPTVKLIPDDDYLLGKLNDGDPAEPQYATRYLQRKMNGNAFSLATKTQDEYRFLDDGMTLGGQSYKFGQNYLGGCRVTFGIKEKVADITTNDGNVPYIESVSNSIDNFQTDNIAGEIIEVGGVLTTQTLINNNTEVTYSASMNLGGNKDPHLAGDQRGYQRGEIYRFGVQVYDLNGSPGNVLWIGDIQTPEMYDLLRMMNVDSVAYDPLQVDSTYLNGDHKIISFDKIKDHRISTVWGHSIPPVACSWFNDNTSVQDSQAKPEAYINADGTRVDTNTDNLNPGLGLNATRKNKWYPGYIANTLPQYPDSLNNYDSRHYLFDLFVNFEFLIPQEVCEKISGFRVVRAERKEIDRRVLQQGLLNQTMKYGRIDQGLQRGYYQDAKFSVDDNENYSGTTDFPFSNATNTDPQFLEYDTFLNGYVGLAENSHIARYEDGITTGKLTVGGVTEGQVYVMQENENQVGFYGSYPYRDNLAGSRSANSLHVGMGAPGEKSMHSAYFGSYEKCQNGQVLGGGAAKLNRHAWITDNIFTLDCPDSSFGTYRYATKEGDMLRIDSLLKLTDELRYTADLNQPNYPSGWYRNGVGEASSGNTTSWQSPDKSIELSQALRFSSKRQTELNEKNGILIGKYYVYDPSWGIDFEISGGNTFVTRDFSNSVFNVANPNRDYRQMGTIVAAKEIIAGEILSSTFFENDDSMTSGQYSGFSNNTLGFVGDYVWYAQFSSITNDIQAGYATANADDFNYDTISTMQQGLRSIVIEVGRDLNGNTLSMYNFHPRNLSMILQNQSFLSRQDNGTFYSDADQQYNYVLGNSKSAQTIKSYIPFKYLCSIVRKSVAYGGSSKSSIESTRFIPCGNFHPVVFTPGPETIMQFHNSKVFGGDTFVNLYSHQKTNIPYSRISFARWQVFPVESFTNTDMRGLLSLNAGDTTLGTDKNLPPFSNDWVYNYVYSQENNIKSGLMIDEERTNDPLDLPYELAYSRTKILGELGDAFRVFPINQFHDMEGKYGQINRVINFKNDIYVLQDEAFAKVLVNPVSMITDDTGSSLFTGTGETLENHLYITTKFGTRHMHSVTTSEQAIYYVDSRYGKIYKYDTETLMSLGDTLGLRAALRSTIKEEGRLDSFNQTAIGDLSQVPFQVGASRNYVSDNYLDFLGIQSTFDHMNKELIVTFHNSTLLNNTRTRPRGVTDIISTTVAYNEGVNAFTSYYSASPSQWLLHDPALIHVGDQYPVSSYLHYEQLDSTYRYNPLQLWLWDSNPLRNVYYQDSSTDELPTADKTVLEKVINEQAQDTKVFDNSLIPMTSDGDGGMDQFSNDVKLSFQTENMNTPQEIDNALVKYRENILRYPIRGSVEHESGNQFFGRARGTYCKLRLEIETSEKFNIFAIMAKYRKSYN